MEKSTSSFLELEFHSTAFFDILPTDWQESILPFWNEYKNSTRVFVLKQNDVIIGGGLVFSTPAPDTKAYEKLAQEYFDSGYLYIGFLWISEEKRGLGLGSFWLKELFVRFPKQKYWLSIEEIELESFYEKHGFKTVHRIDLETSTDWIMTRELV